MIAASCELGSLTGHRAGRQLLERLYREVTGEPLPPILLSPRGKPDCEHSPYHFSITHTDRHAFCVLSRNPVGIDAEELDRPVHPSLVKRVLSSEEQKRLGQAQNQQEAFLTLWVLKEASAKCSGMGLTGFPNKTNFSPEDPRVRRWAGCLVAIICQDGKEGVTYHDF